MQTLITLLASLALEVPLAQDPVPAALAGLESVQADGTYSFGCPDNVASGGGCAFLRMEDWFIDELKGCADWELMNDGTLWMVCPPDLVNNCAAVFENRWTGARNTYGRRTCAGLPLAHTEPGNPFWHICYDFVIYNPGAPQAAPVPESTLLPVDEWTWSTGISSCSYERYSWAWCGGAVGQDCTIEWTHGPTGETWLMIRDDCDGKLMARKQIVDGVIYWECPDFDAFYRVGAPLGGDDGP